MAKLISTFVPEGSYHLAVIDSEREGAWLLRVVCFAVVEKPSEQSSSEVVQEITPMVSDPEDPSGKLTSADDFGDRVLGLVEPGHEADAHWHDLAKQRVEEDRQSEDRKEIVARAREMLSSGEATPDMIEMLREVQNDRHVVRDAAALGVFQLARAGLVYPHMGFGVASRRPAEWVLTDLGAEVLSLSSAPAKSTRVDLAEASNGGAG